MGVRRLHSVQSATSVRVRDGETEITDGPFAVTKEVLAGYYVLDERERARVAGGENQGIPSWSPVGLWRTLPFMFAATVIEAPLDLEPVSPDSFIADLEPLPRDAHARADELVQGAAVAPRRRIYD